MSTAPAAQTDGGGSRFGVDASHASYKWWALSCTSLGMLLATINSGTLIIALPDLERALGTGILALVDGVRPERERTGHRKGDCAGEGDEQRDGRATGHEPNVALRLKARRSSASRAS